MLSSVPLERPIAHIFLLPAVTSALLFVPASVLVVWPWRLLQDRQVIGAYWDLFAVMVVLIIYWAALFPNPAFDVPGSSWQQQHSGFLAGAAGIVCGSLSTSLLYRLFRKSRVGSFPVGFGERI
jgi:uncharacterized membrane protein YdjX (TVP38/TMEM64 family)